MKNKYSYSILAVVLLLCGTAIYCQFTRFSEVAEVNNSVPSPHPSTLETAYYDSGITMSLPEGAGNLYPPGQPEVSAVFNSNYYAYLGYKGQITIDLSISKGLAKVGGEGRACSIENFNNRGASTSTTEIVIDGQTFIHAKQFDVGMNQQHDIDRYVQMIDGDTCRYIEFYRHSGNIGAYTDDPEKTAQIKQHNTLFGQMLDEIRLSAFQSIKVSPPLTKQYDREKLLNVSNEIFSSFATEDYKRLSEFVNPQEGIYLSIAPMVFGEARFGWVNGPVDDFNATTTLAKNFSKAQVSNANESLEEFFFGNTDGKGDPIKGTLKFFLKRWIYNRDYAHAEEIAINEIKGSGNSINTIVKDIGPRNFVVFYFPPDLENGLHWSSLYLIFDEIEGEYKLRAIVKDNWTI